MKLQTTKKAVKNSFTAVISIGYCNAQYLLYYKSPFAYSAGVYGWACDYYQFGSKCISTGYSPFGKHIEYKLTLGFEQKACEIVNNCNLSYDDKVRKVDSLLAELLALVD